MRISQVYENAIYDWCKRVLPTYTVIWDKQSVATPSAKYIAIDILTSGLSEEVNSPNITNPSTDNYKYTLAESMSVQFKLFADDAYLADMGKLRRSYYHAATQTALATAGLTRQKVLSVVDLTGLQNTGFKFACALDVFLGYKIDDTVQSDGEISRVSGEVLGVDFDTNDNI